MRELDAQLVGAPGLIGSSRRSGSGHATPGSSPTDMLGTETVARLLGLRLNHPQGSEYLERLPAARLARRGGLLAREDPLARRRPADREIAALPTAFAFPDAHRLAAPSCSPARSGSSASRTSSPGCRRRSRQLWSSTAPGTDHAPGGFDCSGFVWRVYKLAAVRGRARARRVLAGRTTYAMSGEVKPQRIGRRDPSPATSCSSAPAARSRSRQRSATWGSTSATAGSCTRRATA